VILIVCLGFLGLTSLAQAAAVRPGFDSIDFYGNDDASVGPVSIGFTLNFFGVNFTELWVNNNGNVTLDGSMWEYTPFVILSNTRKIIAPFFADVDTRVGNTTKYGSGTVDGHNAFGVSWREVGYFNKHIDKLNTFQLILIERSDIAAGDFDIEFNYDQIQWETGDVSGGSGGLGGYSARAGWSNGVDTAYEIPGAGINGAYLDGGPNSLVGHMLNSSVLGRYVFEVRNGYIPPPPPPVVPVPPAFLLLGSGLLGMAVWKKIKR